MNGSGARPPTRLRRALFEQILPFWRQRAFDPASGGFVSALDRAGAPVQDAHRLCLVHGRLLYVFSHEAVLNGAGAGVEAARHCRAFLNDRLKTTNGLYAKAFDVAGKSTVGPCDFYDQAFVLLGLAWYNTATGEAEARRCALDLLAALDEHLAHPAGGYREDGHDTQPRRQNPHMHLLESYLAWAEFDTDPLWRERATGIVDLFLGRFYDADTGTVREFVGDDLGPLPGTLGAAREPGHSMEWVWLLCRHHRLIGDRRLLDVAQRLYDVAWTQGRSSSGLLVSGFADGRITDATTLLWPQTEAVKAALALHEVAGEPLVPALTTFEAMVRHHMPDGGPLWINHLDGTGQPVTRVVPTRVLYHLVMAMAEMLRLGADPG